MRILYTALELEELYLNLSLPTYCLLIIFSDFQALVC